MTAPAWMNWDEMKAALQGACEAFDRLTPEQQAAHQRQQKRSYVVSEMALGSDADEAEWAAAYRAGDEDAVARLNAAAEARRRHAEALLDKIGL